MTIRADHIIHNNSNRIKLRFFRGNNQVNPQMLPSEINRRVRKIKGCYISKNLAAWNFPYRNDGLEFLRQAFPNQTILYNAPESSEEQLPPVAHTTPEKQNTQRPEKTKNETPAYTANVKQATIRIDKENKRFFVAYRGYNPTLWAELRKIENGFWQKEQRQWIFKGTNDTYKTVCSAVKLNGYRIEKQTEPTMLERQTTQIARQFVRAMQMRNYSHNTIEAYLPWFSAFVAFFGESQIQQTTQVQIHEYVEKTIREQALSDTQSRHLMSAVKFYYEKMTGKPRMFFKLRSPEKNKKEVNKFSILENQLLCHIKNPSHQLLLFLYLELQLSFNTIAQLTLEQSKQLLQKTEDQNTYRKFKNLLRQHYCKTQTQIYVFELEKKQLSEAWIKKIHTQLTQRYPVGEYFKNLITSQLCNTLLNQSTQKNYLSYLLGFFSHHKWVEPDQISNQQINDYIFYLRNQKKASSSHINNQINALKLYYIEILKRQQIDFGTFVRPKRAKKLPTVLSAEEIQQMILVTQNLKHRTIITMLYSSGLRRSELLNLKIADIDFARGVINVRKGKGSKDRQTTLAKSIIPVLHDYMKLYNPQKYLFEGATGATYSTRSLEKIIKQAAKKAAINKNVTPHTLRHSFATHLLENSTDIRYIQELLGHNSIKTTEIYTHVAIDKRKEIQSPLDIINKKSETWKPP